MNYNNKQGSIIIIESCGCKVDHGIPTRCKEHKIEKKVNCVNEENGSLIMIKRHIHIWMDDQHVDLTEGDKSKIEREIRESLRDMDLHNVDMEFYDDDQDFDYYVGIPKP